MPSLHGGSLEITLTVPLRECYHASIKIHKGPEGPEATLLFIFI